MRLEGTTIEGILAAGVAVLVGLFFLFSEGIAYCNVVILRAQTSQGSQSLTLKIKINVVIFTLC